MHTPRGIFIAVFVLLITLASNTGAVVQDENLEPQPSAPAPLDQIEEPLQVTVKITQQSEDVTALIDVRVDIVNWGNTALNLEKVELLMPQDFLVARGKQNEQEPSILWKENPHKLLNPKTRFFWSFRAPRADVYWYSPVRNFRLLTFFPDEYDVWLQSTYKRTGDNGNTEVTTKIAKIKLKPPLMSLVWGGIVGAGLLGAFVSAYRYSSSSPRPSLAQQVASALAFFVAGPICTVIAILLLHRTGDLPLPVNFTVHDFYGSIVISLFSGKIGAWLEGLFFGDANKSSTAPAQKS